MKIIKDVSNLIKLIIKNMKQSKIDQSIRDFKNLLLLEKRLLLTCNS